MTPEPTAPSLKFAAPARAVKQNPSKAGQWWPVLLLVGVAAGLPYGWQAWRRPMVAPPAAARAAAAEPLALPRLAFRASREDSDWRLVWDRDKVWRLDPLGAVLTIRDGEVERLQYLDRRDLAAGAIL